ncbi:MAG: hypothetical protein IT161_02990 [Bryobacterales bacterium]|nr:hypothetical protein [Bryobacterales bacterium]
MKTMGRCALALAAGAFLFATAAWAQLGTATKFDIPFGFEAGGKAMPPGSYALIKRADQIAVLHNAEARTGVVNFWKGADTNQPSDRARMVFLKTGDRYILKSGEIPGFIARWSLGKEPMAIQASSGAREVVILARR